MSAISQLARNGSISSTSSVGSSINLSIRSSILTHFNSIPNLPTWLEESWLMQSHRPEQIATGSVTSGMAILSRQMMEMHIRQAPDIRGMLDCLPVVDEKEMRFIGWRPKLATWPNSNQESLRSRIFAL